MKAGCNVARHRVLSIQEVHQSHIENQLVQVSIAQLKLFCRSVTLLSSIENNHPILSKIQSQNHLVSSDKLSIVSQFNQSVQLAQSVQFIQSVPLFQSCQSTQLLQSIQSAQSSQLAQSIHEDQ